MELPVVDRSSVSLWSHAYRDWPENRRISTRTNACVLLQIQVASAFCCCLYCTVIALVVVHVNMLRHTKHEQEMTALCWVRKFVCSVTIAPQPQSNKRAFTDIPSKHIYQMHWSKKCAVYWTYTCHLGDYFRINLGQLIAPDYHSPFIPNLCLHKLNLFYYPLRFEFILVLQSQHHLHVRQLVWFKILCLLFEHEHDWNGLD